MTGNPNLKTLGISPSTRGLGFALFEGSSTLVDWGVKVSKSGDKNAVCLAHAANLLDHYHPDLLVLPETEETRRAQRVRALAREMEAMALGAGVRVARVARKSLHRAALRSDSATKHALAKFLASQYPDELGFRLPRRRRIWSSEPHQMDIFDAVALARHGAQTLL